MTTLCLALILFLAVTCFCQFMGMFNTDSFGPIIATFFYLFFFLVPTVLHLAFTWGK